jgi:hypothetical protein
LDFENGLSPLYTNLYIFTDKNFSYNITVKILILSRYRYRDAFSKAFLGTLTTSNQCKVGDCFDPIPDPTPIRNPFRIEIQKG